LKFFPSFNNPDDERLPSLLCDRSLTVLHKPEPVRTSPLALQYSVSEIALEGGVHPEELVSAFGFE
jgi:hypothetical protein